VAGRRLRLEEFLQEFRVARGLFGHERNLPVRGGPVNTS
jgi:hypothetical protein